MKCIHFICRRAQRVEAVAPPVYTTGHWDVSTEDAQRLVGGKLFLHEAKDQPSYFGGTVEGFDLVRVEEKAHEQRVIFRLRSQQDCKGVKWRGARHAMAWTSGVVDCEG